MPITITIKSDYENKDEQDRVKRMLKADDAFYALSCISDKTRGVKKHWGEEDFTYERVIALMEEIDEYICETGLHEIYN